MTNVTEQTRDEFYRLYWLEKETNRELTAENERLSLENQSLREKIIAAGYMPEHDAEEIKETELWLKARVKQNADEIARLTEENTMYAENITYLSAHVLRCDEKIGKLERDKINLHHRIEELEAVLRRIDAIAPAADDTCLEPGITLSEAVRRQLRDDSIDTCDNCDQPAYQYWIDGTRYCREHQINQDSLEMERGQ